MLTVRHQMAHRFFVKIPLSSIEKNLHKICVFKRNIVTSQCI